MWLKASNALFHGTCCATIRKNKKSLSLIQVVTENLKKEKNFQHIEKKFQMNTFLFRKQNKILEVHILYIFVISIISRQKLVVIIFNSFLCYLSAVQF